MWGRRWTFTGAMALLAGLTAAGGIAAQPSGGVPDPAKIHQVRANCHNAYDLLFADFAKGARPAPAEAQWAVAYEEARGTGRPCPPPPASLLTRANGHIIVTEDGMAGVVGFVSNQKDPVAMFEVGLASSTASSARRRCRKAMTSYRAPPILAIQRRFTPRAC